MALLYELLRPDNILHPLHYLLMDQKFVAEGGKLTAGLLFFCALMVIPLGLGMVFSYPDQIWWLGLVMLASGAVFIHSGIKNLKQSARMSKQVEAEMKAVAQALSKPKAYVSEVATSAMDAGAKPELNILARWTYTREEWKRFILWETRKRRLSTSIEAGLILIVGGVFVHMVREADWVLSFCCSVLVASAYWLGKYFLSMNSIGKARGTENEVIVLRDGVVINGKYNAIRSELYRLKSANMLDTESPMIIEFVYEWRTRKGMSNDEIRIPVPEGKKDEAQKLIFLVS